MIRGTLRSAQGGDRAEWLIERAPERRQRVFDPGRDLRVGGASEDPVALEAPERLGQHLGRDAADAIAEMVEAMRAEIGAEDYAIADLAEQDSHHRERVSVAW